jgi:hypothetical protein
MTHKEKFKAISQIADKVLKFLEDNGLPMREKWSVMLDFENVDKICPLDFELLMNSEETLLHDYAGICRHFDRTTLNWEENAMFVPRSALKEVL